MKYWKLYLYLLIALPLTVSSQSKLEKQGGKVASIQHAYDNFTADNIGNVYLYKADEILKYSPDGDSLGIYSNKVLGNVHWIDVSFPLKPLVFFESKSQIQVLDNTLSAQNEVIDLTDYDLFEAEAVCSSYENNSIWIFTTDNTELIKLNYQDRTEKRSGNLNNILGKVVNITFMVEVDNRLYANNDGEEILVFDINGTYIKSLAIQADFDFLVTGNKILYRSNTKFEVYDTKSFESKLLYEFSEGIEKYILRANFEIIGSKEKIVIIQKLN
jgi:hypothetical protein